MAKGLVWLQTNGSIMTIILTSITLFIRLNAVAFIYLSGFPMRRLFEGGVCFEITFLKSLAIVTVNRF